MKNPIKPINAEKIQPVRKNTADFVQITRGYLSDIQKLTAKSPIATRILLFLTERMTRQNAIVVSQPTLAEIMGCNVSTVYRAIQILQKDNWLQIVKIGQANGYLINSRVVWRSHQNKRFGYFNAEVIASETEQSQTIEELETQPLKHIPNVKVGEMMISDDADLPPPDQRDLIEPDFEVVPHLKGE